jgi:hypothetical protein
MANHHGMGRGHHSMGRFAGFGSERFCKERFAREAGFLAYIGAKLDLNAQQQPLWGTYHQAMMDAAGKQRQACVENILPPGSHLTVLERRDRAQKMLQARPDRLQATRPSLEALYQSLSPELTAIDGSSVHRCKIEAMRTNEIVISCAPSSMLLTNPRSPL